VNPLLSVRDLKTAFATEQGLLYAVRGVSFDLYAGETLALVGESGCGKSVTALSIIGLLPPAGRVVGGTVELGGTNLVATSPRAMRRIRGRKIAMVFQDSMTSLNPLLTIGRQLTEGLQAHLGLDRDTACRRAIDLLEEVGVPEPEHRLRQYPHQLSGGLRQRVAVAIALGPNPEILIADEPTTALDVTVQAQVLELLKREQAERNMAVILITHNLGVVAGVADRVCVMYAGRIVEEAPTNTIFSEPRHPYTLGLLQSVPRIDRELTGRLPSIPGNPPALAELPTGCAFRDRCPLAHDRCEVEDPSLEPVSVGGHAAACWAYVGEIVP
jgi:oligopeptide/dipeptide ABC transporter ATP-binding protein